jgi:hypothetical protein
MRRTQEWALPYPPHKNEDDNYIANGELGLVVNGYTSNKYLKVEFSSQPNRTYSFTKSNFKEDGDSDLELAYALTVHKAQGSEFDLVIVILCEPCNLLSREMLYTALTRQTEKLIILFNNPAFVLKNYSSDEFSDIARRFTALFEQPDIVEVTIRNKRYFLENRLIHRTSKGHMVRSKSELVIAEKLFEKKIDYEYEKDLKIAGKLKSPDFTITNLAGETIYWEHCGMMNDSEYRKRWAEKKELYEKNGIKEGENLIVTYDQVNGGLDVKEIEAMILKYFP